MNFFSNGLVQNRYRLGGILGSGLYGTVYQATDSLTGNQVAVKCLGPQVMQDGTTYNLIQNEIRVLSRVRHANIVRLLETFNEGGNLYMVYELCNAGTLKGKIASRGRLSESEALSILSQLASSVLHLKNSGVIHRDIKPENILFNGNQLKLGDFGFCTESQGFTDRCFIGSIAYQAPEIHSRIYYSPLTDVYSLGITLYEMLTGSIPFRESDASNILNVKMSLFINPIPGVSPGTMQLLRGMCSPFEGSRFHIEEVYNRANSLCAQIPMSTGAPLMMNVGSTQSILSLSNCSTNSITSIGGGALQPVSLNITQAPVQFKANPYLQRMNSAGPVLLSAPTFQTAPMNINLAGNFTLFR